MENTVHNRARMIYKVFLFTGAGILVIYVVLSLFSTGYTMARLQELCLTEGAREDEVRGQANTYPQLTELVRYGAYLNSRYSIAESDSIGLCLNLKDSLVTLEINGVVIHRARLTDYRVDPFLYALSDDIYQCLFSVPFTVEEERGSVIKEPVILQKAPRDTIEAARFFPRPDTVFRGPQWVMFEMSHGLLLRMEECAGDGSGGRCVGRWANRIRSAIYQSNKNLSAMVLFRIPVYRPEIRISLPVHDIVSIYRALPDRASVAVRL
jgi:hypothetical protein